MSQRKFYAYSNYLIDKYGAKTYKCPIHIPSTCPNRDGTLGYDGCAFCSEKGTGFESLHHNVDVSSQIEHSRKKMKKRYKAQKFIGYFQNYTNTYMPLHEFINYIDEALTCDLVGIDIATRPDTLPDAYLEALYKIKEDNKINITFELGLQIANDVTLKEIQRGHTVADYVQTAQRIKAYGFELCTHLILNLPETSMEDVVYTAQIVNSVGTECVKLHSLYVAKGSLYEKMYHEGRLHIGSVDEYVQRVVLFLCYLNPEIAIARFVSRIPEEESVFSNWDKSWWHIYNQIITVLDTQELHQGIYYQEDNYGK